MVISWEAGNGTRQAGHRTRDAGRGTRMACGRSWGALALWRSRDFEELSGEISQYLRAARGKMDIVLDADSSPTRTVDARLDRHHGALSQQGFDGFRQPRRFVHFQPQPVTEAVSEGVAVPTVLNVATSQTVGILPFHSRSHGFRGDSIGVSYDLVDLALLTRGGTDHKRPRDVGAVALVLRAEIQQQKIAPLDHA